MLRFPNIHNHVALTANKLVREVMNQAAKIIVENYISEKPAKIMHAVMNSYLELTGAGFTTRLTLSWLVLMVKQCLK